MNAKRGEFAIVENILNCTTEKTKQNALLLIVNGNELIAIKFDNRKLGLGSVIS
jgi:hypothetical protein